MIYEGWEHVLRAESEPNRNASLHLSEDSLDDGPVHRVLKTTFYLFDVVFC